MTQGATDRHDDGPEDYDGPGADPAPVLDISTGTRDEDREHDSTRDWQPVTLDGELVYVRRPKGAFMIRMALKMQQGDDVEQALAMNEVLDKLFDPDSRALIQARLEDDEDDLDMGDMMDALNKLRELWSSQQGSRPRPTGNASGSRPRAPRSGRPSTARSR